MGAKEGDRPWGVRRCLGVVGGGFLLMIGAALLILPGPGIPFILAGLAILGREFGWARRLLARTRLLRRRFAARRRRGRP